MANPSIPKTKQGSRAARSSKKTAASQAQQAEQTARTEQLKPKGDAFSAEKSKRAKVALQSAAKALEPALLRTLNGVAQAMKTGAEPDAVAVDAMRSFARSPEMMAAFAHAQPALFALGDKVGIGKLGRATLPYAISGEKARALLELGNQVAGRPGKRIIAAAMRGFRDQGLEGSVAQVARTAAKISAAPGGNGFLNAVGKGVGKALPVLGNAANIAMLTASLKALVDTYKRADASLSDKLARCLHVACGVAGCFIPAIGIVGDIAVTAIEQAARKTAAVAV